MIGTLAALGYAGASLYSSHRRNVETQRFLADMRKNTGRTPVYPMRSGLDYESQMVHTATDMMNVASKASGTYRSLMEL